MIPSEHVFRIHSISAQMALDDCCRPQTITISRRKPSLWQRIRSIFTP